MAQLILNIPDAVINDVITVYAAAHQWTPEKGDKAAFCKAILIEGIMQVLRGKYGSDAAESARLAAVAQVNANVKIT